ncbi:hypothetical protein A2U01_0053687, partial [Trifolium medium]|nr:hypothetical protein [Trifolium medium]
PAQQPSVGERSVVIPSPSCNVGHRESQSSPARNRNTGAAGGCMMDPDAADAADAVEEVKVVLLLVLPEDLTVLSERIIAQVAPED